MGIDIRDGPQLECIHCALCIDACDEIMDKVERPRGLIAYDTDRAIWRRRDSETRSGQARASAHHPLRRADGGRRR